jgi:hypothetical protein
VSVQKIPAMRVLDVRRAIGVQRGHDAVTLDELMDDGLLAAIADLVKPGQRVTKAGLAQAVEDAKAKAAAQIGSDRCWCGHAYTDHLARVGCLECDACSGKRHVPMTPQPGVHAVGADVLVIRRGSKYYALAGLVVAREDGGLSVLLPGSPRPLPFEHSELCTIPRPTYADYAKRGKRS